MKSKTFSNPNEVNTDLMRQDRINSALDQESVGDVMGLSPTTVSSWEMGKRTPKINHLVRFASIIGQDPKKYVEGDALRQVTLYIAHSQAVMEYAGLA